MTTYSEEACPFKDNCNYPDHNHTTPELDTILTKIINGNFHSRQQIFTVLQAYTHSEVIKALENIYERRYMISDLGWSKFVVSANDIKEILSQLKAEV